MTSPHSNDRETLSALFDGELDGEARRFAMRRLSHDTGWQEDCGRWQLIGDAMRRQAPIAAPADLAERVRRELSAPPAQVAVAPALARVAPAARPPYRLWVGGALAASVALAAVIGLRSPSPVPSVPRTAPAVAAAVLTAVPGAAAPADAVDPTPKTTAAPTAASVADVRVARADRPAPVRARAARASSDTDAPAIAAAAPTVALPVDANPFHVPASNPLSSRPWPRTAGAASGAFTASYGGLAESRGDTPSFYPFEPRPSADTSADTSAGTDAP